MTITDITTDTTTRDTQADQTYRGRTFTTATGPVILVAPDTDGSWTVLTAGGLETLVIGSPEWGQDTDDDTLTALLVQAWQTTKEQADRVQLMVAANEELVQDIRSYAIDRHRDGEYCRDGLNRALEHFGLEPYEPRYRVSVIVSGTFDIDADSEDEARRRVRYLIDGIAHSGEEDGDSLDVSTLDIDVSEAEAL